MRSTTRASQYQRDAKGWKNPGSGNRWNDPQRCQTCGSPDSRDAEHAQGCPARAPLSRAELLRIAENVERGWAATAPKARGAAA